VLNLATILERVLQRKLRSMKTGAPNSFKKSNCPIQMTPVVRRNEAIDCGKLTASGVSFMEKSDRAFGSGPGLPLPPSPNENEILSLGLSHARQSAPLRAESADEAEQLDLSVVMPCLNERLTLGACIRKAIATMKAMDIRGEVVVADNGSTDGSQAIALEVGARVIAVETRGYGSALRGGIAAARGKYVVMGDADDSYDFTQLADFVNKLNEGYDLVMGNRFQGGIRPGAMSPLHQFLGNPVLSRLGRLFFKSPIGDFHCGLRAFRKEAIDSLQLQSSGMEFASEMIVKATLFHLRVTEVPTVLSPDGRDRPPHLRTWRDGWRHLRFLLLFSPSWLFLYPGISLFVLGVAMSIWLLPGPQKVRGVTFDLHTLLFGAMSVLMGFQSIYFATFSKVFAIREGLLPEDRRLTRLFRYITLEIGLAIGAVLALLGAGTWVFGLAYWSARHFGAGEPEKTLRIVIPGLVFLTMGVQIILSSFLLSVLGMRRGGTPQP
jgi:glycosyltransferase involved in cell wall biosynthesis